MKLNRTELKKIIYDFNSMSNRLLQADFADYNDVLSKFISFVRGSEIIINYISDCGECDQDLEQEFKEVGESYGDSIFTIGATDSEEVKNVYAILCYIVNNKLEIHYHLASSYSYSDKFQDKIKGFNDRVVMVLIRHIERYLTKIGIDMGLDDKNVYSITVTNGQVNIANDNATIKATMNNGFELMQLSALIQDVRHETEYLHDDDKEAVISSLEVIEQELQAEKPRKNFIKTAISGIKAIKGTAEFAAAVAALIQFVHLVISTQ